jgi:hypothetical protein
MGNREDFGLEIIGCPDCGAPSEIVDRFELASTDGAVEHMKVLCVHRHWFTVAVDRLVSPRSARPTTGREQGPWQPIRFQL